MKKTTDKKSFWNGRGFYAALAVVIGGSALASYLAVNTMMSRLGAPSPILDNSITGQEDTTWDQNGADVNKKQGNIAEKPSSSSGLPNTATSPSASGASSSGQQEPASWQPAQAASFTWPMRGKVSQKFSGDELVFNKTMQDWRTHNGTDILGAVNNAVKAPMGGQVVFAGEDAQWGGVVEIQSGKLRARLCGLKNLKVHKDDKVSAGDVLGELGALPAESVDEAHLHIEVLNDGKLTDPAEYFAS